MERAVVGGMPAVPVRVRCACSVARALPIRLVSDTLSEIRAALAGRIEPRRPVMTYRCRICKEIVILRAEDLYLAVAEERE